MNKTELERFKKQNEDLRVLNIVEALFQEDDLELSFYVFYEDEIGVNAKEILVDQVFEKWVNFTYDDKEDIIKQEMGWDIEYTRKDILLNKREIEEQECDYVGGMMNRMIEFCEILVGIMYLEPKETREEEIIDYIKEVTKDGSVRAIETYRGVLKHFGINEKELKDLVLRIGESFSTQVSN